MRFQRLQRWFRHHGKKSLKADKVDHLSKILGDFIDANIKAPRHNSTLHIYQRNHYDTRVKATADVEYAQACAAALASGSNVPVQLAFNNAVTKRLLEAESAEFHEQLRQEVKEDYEERLADYQANTTKPSLPSTPEEYHRYAYALLRLLASISPPFSELQAAGHWLNTFAEHISRRLGMNVSIFIAGPIGENGGEVGVRWYVVAPIDFGSGLRLTTCSVHIGQMPGLTPKLWPEFDETTFAAVTKSMVKFARICFCASHRVFECINLVLTAPPAPDDCQARALPSASSDDLAGLQAMDPDDRLSNGLSSTGTSRTSTPVPATSVPPTTSLLTGAVARAGPLLGRGYTKSSSPPISSPLRGESAPPLVGKSKADGVAVSSSSAISSVHPILAAMRGKSSVRAASMPMHLPRAHSVSPPSHVTTSQETQQASLPLDISTTLAGRLPQFLDRGLSSDMVSSAASVTFTPVVAASTLGAATPIPAVVTDAPAATTSTSVNATFAPGEVASPPAAATSTRGRSPDDMLSWGFGIPTLLNPSAAPAPHAYASCSPHPSAVRDSGEGLGILRSHALADLDDCPEDVRSVVQYLLGNGGWGHRWQKLVELYVAIEHAAGFHPHGRLLQPTDRRPPEIAAWMKHHRPLADISLDDAHAFTLGWWEWWYSNQPADRPTDKAGWYTTENGAPATWSQLYVTGPNGLVLFLLSAAWWGAAVEGADSEAQQDWLDAVEDLSYVFAEVLAAAKLLEAFDDSAFVAPASQRYVSSSIFLNSPLTHQRFRKRASELPTTRNVKKRKI